MAKYNPEEEDFNIWPTYSDIGFAIVLILVFIILAQYVVIGKIIQINEIEQEQNLLSERLQETFPREYGTAIQDATEPQLQKITFSDRILFDSGSDIIKLEGRRILRGVANILNELRSRRKFDEIQIRGHTDDIPISTARFPTNWELSSARATSVVRFFVDECKLRPENGLLLSAQGYSEFDAIRVNDNSSNRALNRRIEIVIKYPLPY